MGPTAYEKHGNDDYELDELHPKVAQGTGRSAASRPSGSRKILFAVVAIVVVLAIALGVGLGVGLHHHKSSSSSSSAPGSVNGTNSTTSALVQAPPASSFFLQGASLASQAPTTRYYHFVLDQRQGAPDGFEKSMLVVNGSYPGPTIEANSYDRIIVNVTNNLPNSTAIHWHGLYQRGTPFYDGTNSITQCGIPPGESLVYNFTMDGWYGTTWWHAHYSTQYTDGVTGSFIVHGGANETAFTPAYDQELVLHMADLYHGFSADLLQQYLSTTGMTGEGLTGVTQGNEPVSDAGTLNGVGQWGNYSSYANYTLSPNTTYRLRLINAGTFAAVHFSVDSHILTVIEADGVPVQPYDVAGLDIEVAQRYSVLLRTNQTAGAYWMRATVSQDSFTYTEPDANYNILGVARYGVNDTTLLPNATLADNDPGAGDNAPGDLDTTLLVPAEAMNPPNSTISYTITISMQNAAGNHWLSFVNSTSWSPLTGTATLFNGLGNTSVGAQVFDSSQFIITVPTVQVVDVVINNYDDGDHPFHLHGYKFWIMGSGAGKYQGQALNTVNPMRRDTQLFEAYTWTVIRFVADNPGWWAFHCHLGWHMSAGLLMQWAVLPSEVQSMTFPQVMLDQCKSAADSMSSV